MTNNPSKDGESFISYWGVREWLAVIGLYTAVLGSWFSARSHRELMEYRLNEIESKADYRNDTFFTVSQHGVYAESVAKRFLSIEEEVKKLRDKIDGSQ